MFSAVRKRMTARQERARVDVLTDEFRPRPFKPEWLLEADRLAPTVTNIYACTDGGILARGIARKPAIDDVATTLAEAYPNFRGNRFDRRARRFQSRAARRAAFRTRLAAGKGVDAASKAYDAYIAGCRGRSAEPKSAKDKALVYIAQRPGRRYTPAQDRRTRKTLNKAVGA